MGFDMCRMCIYIWLANRAHVLFLSCLSRFDNGGLPFDPSQLRICFIVKMSHSHCQKLATVSWSQIVGHSHMGLSEKSDLLGFTAQL